jgi:hypothetical protein
MEASYLGKRECRGKGRWVKYLARLGCWISPYYGPFSFGMGSGIAFSISLRGMTKKNDAHIFLKFHCTFLISWLYNIPWYFTTCFCDLPLFSYSLFSPYFHLYSAVRLSFSVYLCLLFPLTFFYWTDFVYTVVWVENFRKLNLAITGGLNDKDFSRIHLASI